MGPSVLIDSCVTKCCAACDRHPFAGIQKAHITKKATRESGYCSLCFLEAPIGIEPMNGRFAVW